MRLIAFCLLTLSVFGQEITDLGVVSLRRGIILEKDTNQVDFLHFKIELIPLRWNFNTNAVVFTTTNTLLTLENFMTMPPGPCIMGVRSVSSDGDESSIELYRVHVRRDAPKPPKAHPASLGGVSIPIHNQTATNVLQSRFHSRTNRSAAPPLPPGAAQTHNPEGGLSREAVRAMAMAEEAMHDLTNLTVSATVPTFPGPLPGGSPKTYSDHMVEMHDFNTRANHGQRRSE